MALRDQPYLPLYVQDFMTDEKLTECSAKSIGVYIFIMCFMHKSEDYGIILLKQKDKIGSNDIENFALKLIKHLPFSKVTIEESIKELIEEKVLYIKDEKLCQKRMIKDNELSLIRSGIGKKGGKSTQLANKLAKAKYKASSQPNTENENEIENENINKDNILTKEEKERKKRDLLNIKYKKFKQEIIDLFPMMTKWEKEHLITGNGCKPFIKHWTEPNKSFTKLKFELETTWDLKGRIDTWLKNAEKYESKAN